MHHPDAARPTKERVIRVKLQDTPGGGIKAGAEKNDKCVSSRRGMLSRHHWSANIQDCMTYILWVRSDNECPAWILSIPDANKSLCVLKTTVEDVERMHFMEQLWFVAGLLLSHSWEPLIWIAADTGGSWLIFLLSALCGHSIKPYRRAVLLL